MQNNWAAEHLQVIRTLMERSALYRRALAPVMIFAGIVGLTAGAVGWGTGVESRGGFIGCWFGAALLAIAGSFLLVRRQALRDAEPFWSPPTRRVAQALLTPLFVGAFAGVIVLTGPAGDAPLEIRSLPGAWMLLYGCALAAAGFFMPRGIKLLGWIFVLCGCSIVGVQHLGRFICAPTDAHLLMGGAFGGLHLAYGVYLYFTERRGKTS